MRKVRTAAALLAALALGACATTPNPNAVAENDPYESTNREIFALDQKFDHFLLQPTAEYYDEYVPDSIRNGAHNFLTNLDTPAIFSNDMLQGKAGRAGQTLLRFSVNTTLGIGGIFDMASRLGVPSHSADFGQTLALWGAGEGPYLVLPILGPDPPRDAIGQAMDFAFDPTVYVHFRQHIWWALGRKYLTIVDVRARNLETLTDIERASLDYYATTRSLYRQYRNNEIHNGGAPPQE
jgi:phospholipid-binding lipoprotein MlaA